MAICKSSSSESDYPKLHGSDDNGIGNSDNNDMWSLIRPGPRSVSDAFVSLLSANGDRCQWEKKQPSYSRNSSVNGFQLCTEGLGCESCDGLADSDDSCSNFSFSSSSSSSSPSVDVLAEEDEDEDEDDDDDIEAISEEDGGDSENNFSAEEDDNYMENAREEMNGTKNARKFPPPLPWICRSNASSVFMRSYKKDGRFVLQAVKVRSSKYLQAFREGGRLKMQLITADEELREILAPEVRPGTDSDGQNDNLCPEPESCSDCCDLAIGKPCAEFAPPEFLSPRNFVETLESFARRNYNLAFPNAGILFNFDCEIADDGRVSSKRRTGGGALTEMKTAHSSVKSRGMNAYHGWRSTSQRTSGFCHGTQNLEKSPSPSAWALRYAFEDERRAHSLPKFRSKELAYGRCEQARALNPWAHCVATST